MVTRARPGRKAFVPTPTDRKQVEVLAAAGVPHLDIALCIQGGIGKKTLAKYFAEELRIGGIKANAAIAGRLYTLAMSGNVAALIFWAKTRIGWRETGNGPGRPPNSGDDDEEEGIDPLEVITNALNERLARIAARNRQA